MRSSPFSGSGRRASCALALVLLSSGGGTVTDSTSTSDVDGHAMMTYTAGSTPGLATIVATVAQVWTASFTVHIVAPTSSVSMSRAR